MEQTLIRSPQNMLVLRSLDGTDHPLSDVTLVGREAECQVQLIEGHASRYHAKLTVTGSHQLLVEDLKSTNGTYVNGQRVETPIVATLGDELRFDTSRFRIATAHSGGAQATVFRRIDDLRETLAPAATPQPKPAAPKPAVPKPAPQPHMMTPAPQQPEFASPLSTTPAPAAEIELPDFDVELESMSALDDVKIDAQAEPDVADTDINRTVSGVAAPKPAADESSSTARSKPKKVAQFQPQDQPSSTGTSSLPADELVNLASKSSRTVRRLESTQGPRLIVLNPPARGMVFPLAESGVIGEWLVGRGEDADIALTDRTVSVRHAIIRKTGNRWEIENLNATNGVFVNGKLISRRLITTGDKVRLGRTEMQFRTDAEAGAAPQTAGAEEEAATKSSLTPGMLLALAGAVFVALFALILILVLQRGP